MAPGARLRLWMVGGGVSAGKQGAKPPKNRESLRMGGKQGPNTRTRQVRERGRVPARLHRIFVVHHSELPPRNGIGGQRREAGHERASEQYAVAPFLLVVVKERRGFLAGGAAVGLLRMGRGGAMRESEKMCVKSVFMRGGLRATHDDGHGALPRARGDVHQVLWEEEGRRVSVPCARPLACSQPPHAPPPPRTRGAACTTAPR